MSAIERSLASQITSVEFLIHFYKCFLVMIQKGDYQLRRDQKFADNINDAPTNNEFNQNN